MRRRTWVRAAAAILAAAAVTGGLAVISRAKPAAAAAAAAARSPAVGTARVQRTTLSAKIAQAGILTFRARPDGSPYVVINRARGTYTKLPAVGRVIQPGHVLYRVDGHPVVLLRGSTPAYRTLAAGASGPDVAELNADLIALGYGAAAQLRGRPDSFRSATTAAVMRLQASLGVARTGRLTLGQVVFEPSAVRVTSVSGQLGAGAQPGETAMQGTSTVRQVQVALSAAQQTTLAVADKVSITLPDNRTTPGVVSAVGSVATCPSSSGSGGPGGSSSSGGSGSAPPETDSCSSQSSGGATPTITVAITPSEQAAAGRWDQAPVQVAITTARVRNVLVVPVTALLARSGGGYAVEVAGGARPHLVPVSLGLFDDAEGVVQVRAAGLAPGERVVVPST